MKRVALGLVAFFGLFAFAAACGAFSSDEGDEATGTTPIGSSSGDAQADARRFEGEPVDAAGDGGAATPDATTAPPSETGCADGTREGFIGRASIAACDGAWTMRGIFTGAAPTCERGAGNEATNDAGVGCSAQDLCSLGWHVCSSAGEVIARDGNCVNLNETTAFYATAQPSDGNAVCGGTGTNDVFGCGAMATPFTMCPPLNAVLSVSQDFAGFAFVEGGGTDERAQVTKRPTPGGVLCCTD